MPSVVSYLLAPSNALSKNTANAKVANCHTERSKDESLSTRRYTNVLFTIRYFALSNLNMSSGVTQDGSFSSPADLFVTSYQQQQQQQPFNGRLSGTTRVGWYQKKHSPAHTHPGQRTSFITFLHLQRSMASSLFSLHA